MTVVGVPAAMTYPPTEEKILSWYEISGDFRTLCEQSANLGLNFWRGTFIGIEAKNPIVGSVSDGVIPEFAKGFELVLKDFVREFRSNLRRGVGTVGVNEDNFVSPPGAFKTGTDVRLIVVADDDD